MSNEISEVARRDISDFFADSNLSWCGRFNDAEFLARLYDLTKLPSNDRRFMNAASDIWQHCVNNSDWDKNWVFFDARFNLLHVSDEEFSRFLCETIHPVVRPHAEDVKILLDEYNQRLAADGWELVEGKKLSSRPSFVAQRHGKRMAIFVEPTGWQKVDRQMHEVRSRLDEATTEEQYQAVGLICREVLISVAQEVFRPSRHLTIDGTPPSDTDAKRMLEAIFDIELKGSTNEEARAHAKAALRLTLALQHKRTADFRMAALCAEATLSVTNLLAIIAGRRGQSLK